MTVEQTAWVLNCQTHDIPVLVSARLLRPLGNPPANGTKYFSTEEVLEMSKDRSWLAKITNTVCQHWRNKNARKCSSFNDQRADSSSPLELLAAKGSR